jgi:hypothetical protein
MRELWLNNQLVDLDDKEPIAITKQVNNLNELKDRQANYSNQFKIPPSENNLRICGYPNIVSSDSINPYTKLPCRYIENGTEQISNGYAIIEIFDIDIQVTLYSGILDFFDLIADKSLRDLDFSDADHIFNLTNFVNSFSNDKYVYPLIQWGATDKNNLIVDIRYQLPALYYSYILDKIFSATGYNKSGNVFALDSYKALTVPIVEDALYDSEAVLHSYSFEAHIQNQVTYTLNAQSRTIDVFSYFSSGSAFDSSAGFYKAGFSKYQPGNKVTGNAKIELWIQASGGSGEIILVKNTSSVNSNILDRVSVANGFTGRIVLSADNITLEPGETIFVYINTFYGKLTIYPTSNTSPASYSYFAFTATNTIDLGQKLIFKNLVPDIKQTDFIKDLAYEYGLIFQIDPIAQTVNFVQFNEIANKKYILERLDATIQNLKKQYPKAKFDLLIRQLTALAEEQIPYDWSDKIYYNSQDPRDPNNPKLQFRFDGYGQKSYLRWNQDDDRGTIGDDAIIINDNTLQPTTDLFTTTFSSSLQEVNFKGAVGVNIKRFTRVEADTYSPTQDYSEGDKALYNEIVYEALGDVSGVTPGTDPDSWKVVFPQYEKTESASPRLLLIKNYDINTLTYTDGTSSTNVAFAKMAYFADSSQPFDLTFQYLIENNYSGFVSVLNKLKVVTAYFWLDDNEFKDFNFFKPVYIELFGDYFYVNVISNRVSGRLAQVEIVRL